MADTAGVGTGKVVSIHYTLRLEDGSVVETSQEAFDYLHGADNIVPGLEEALEGKKVGDVFEVSVVPEKGYGTYEEAAVQVANRADFPDDMTLEPGVLFYTEMENGTTVPCRVAGVEDDNITIDFNHPLAGETLLFSVEVMSIREATAEERTHGHPGAGGGCCDVEENTDE